MRLGRRWEAVVWVGAVLFVLCALVVEAASPLEDGRIYYVLPMRARLRSGPSSGATIQAYLLMGDAVKIDARKGRWVLVHLVDPATGKPRGENGKPVCGWMSRRSLSTSKPLIQRRKRTGAEALLNRAVGGARAEMTNTAGTRAVGPLARAMAGAGYLTRADLRKVDVITEFRPDLDVDAFMREGGLGPYASY